ncbi:methyltransferase domain-containing protein [Stachybotrys elegans]|uniref:Methyltransferase domain-containing protein n=1 Tax=Stachybotrys elegans TaxID=80388 RepID=A0A8K0WMM6_9HYPO|nr:methyltransferase domain-containing protein [Stachybotrys elegans]
MPSAMLSLPPSYSSARNYTDDICAFLSTPLVRQITGGIHVNDALIHHAWEKLPPEWTAWFSSVPDHRLVQRHLLQHIEETEPHDLEHSKDDVLLSSQIQPQSLTKWLNTVRSLALPRVQRNGPSISLPDILKQRMKTKKIAEISRATAYIHAKCVDLNITHIIDMGSGQGYLSASLAFLFPNLHILAIDGSGSQIEGSKSFAASLGIKEDRLQHVVHWIDGSSAVQSIIEDWAQGTRCILVGLHACGNLSEHMLRYFVTIPCIQALAAIGCCYNHIIATSPEYPQGFPISSALTCRDLFLSPTAFMAACQVPDNWKTPEAYNKQDNNISVFTKRRLYRAMLERLFYDKGVKLNTEERPAWGTRKSDMVDFTSYTRKAMDSLQIEDSKITPMDLALYEEKYGKFGGQIAILWTLSIICCKVIESAILMDRYWYLEEQNVGKVDVFPIFDPMVSPRNMIVVAEKQREEQREE